MARNEDLQKRRDASIARGIANQLPVFVDAYRTRLPQTNVFNNDTFQLKLVKHSPK